MFCSFASKPASSLIGPGVPITIPRVAQPVAHHVPDYEVELTIVIGKSAKDVSESEALDYVLGYTVGNDVRHVFKPLAQIHEYLDLLQTSSNGYKVCFIQAPAMVVPITLLNSQWSWSKSFDDTTPFGPVLVSAKAVPDPQKLSLKTEVNGKVLQDGTTAYEILELYNVAALSSSHRNQIFNVKQTVAYLSQGTTLEPGTLIMTGTPAGVGQVFSLFPALDIV